MPGPVNGAKVWWTVDPATGETRSILDPGLGGMAHADSFEQSRPRSFDTVNGKASGAGSRAARGYPGQGATQNTGRAWNPNGNGYWENGKYHDLNRPAPEPTTCKSGSEYSTILGCVSIPGALAIGAVLIVVGIAVYYVDEQWNAWING